MKKRYFFSIIAIVVILLLVGCSSEIKDTNDDESSLPEDYSSLIEEATTVNVKERFVSLTKTYDVYVDGKEIGSVSGEYVNITGDIFTLTDANGNEIAKEKQIKRWGVRLNRLANLMDQDGNTTGYIGEEYFTDFFSLSKYNFHIYDSNKNELGYTQEEIMSLYCEFNVYNALTGEILFNISKQPDMVDSYKIVKKTRFRYFNERYYFLNLYNRCYRRFYR